MAYLMMPRSRLARVCSPPMATRLASALMLLLLACSKHEASPGQPSASASVAPAAATSAPAPAPAAPQVSALGVCNRIAAQGAISRCRPDDAGTSAHFLIGSTGAGNILIANNAEHYRKILDKMNFDGFELATSDKALAIAYWKGGGELAAAQIRLVMVQLDAP